MVPTAAAFARSPAAHVTCSLLLGCAFAAKSAALERHQRSRGKQDNCGALLVCRDLKPYTSIPPKFK